MDKKNFLDVIQVLRREDQLWRKRIAMARARRNWQRIKRFATKIRIIVMLFRAIHTRAVPVVVHPARQKTLRKVLIEFYVNWCNGHGMVIWDRNQFIDWCEIFFPEFHEILFVCIFSL